MRRLAAIILALALAAPALALAAESPVPSGEQLAESLDSEHQPGAHEEAGEEHGVAPINWFSWHKGKWIHKNQVVTQQVSEHDEPVAPALVFALANFAIFGFVLLRYAGPVVRKYTRERHESIRDALEEGARLREEARTKLAEYTERIAGVEAEVTRLIADIRATAESERQQILAQAQVQAAALRAETELRIAADIEQAKRELHREVMLRAIEIAEKVIREHAGAADHKAQFESFLGDLDRSVDPEVRS
jgi:F-type H+-transporting ATPase subunit b